MDTDCGGTPDRPGGFMITDRAMRFCGFKKGARLADIGCGSGGSVRHITESYQLSVCGIDKNKDALAMTECLEGLLLVGEAENLPFDDGEMDGLLFECSLSKMLDPDAVLAECNRVLKHHGYLIVSDLYARGKEAHLSGILGRLDTIETFMRRLKRNHFAPLLFEDFSESLPEIWGQMILQYGANALYANIGADSETLRQIRCGYCLLIAQRCGPQEKQNRATP